MNELFRKFSQRSSEVVGSPWAFLVAVATVVVWLVTGPLFGFSNTWQLIINTGTTIVTFLMVFLIQNTQNRDAKALHIKLDELIRSTSGARNDLIDSEDLSDAEIQEIQQAFQQLHRSESAGVKDFVKALQGELGDRSGEKGRKRKRGRGKS